GNGTFHALQSDDGANSDPHAALRHEAAVPDDAEYSRDRGDRRGTGVPGGFYSAPKPALRASTIACARFSTSSLAKMLVMWLRTVLALNPSSAAICAFSRPCAINSTKSRSRGVNASNTGARVSVTGKNARNSAIHRDHAGSASSNR